MKKLLFLLSLLPFTAAAQTIENCQVQEYLGSSYDAATQKYTKQKWTGYEYDGSDITIQHKFKLLEGVKLELRSTERGWIAQIPTFSLVTTLDDSSTNVHLSNDFQFEKNQSWRGIPLNGGWFVYRRPNNDKIIISCNSPLNPEKL